MESLENQDIAAHGPPSAERTRALLMAQRARVPIYFAMAQVAIISVAIPSAIGFPWLASMGVVIFVSLFAALKSVDRSLEAFRACSHFVYFVSLAALAYAVLGLKLSGSLTVYSTATILLGSAYLLGIRPALFWAIPSLFIVGIDSFLMTGPSHAVPPVVSFVVRTVTLVTILAFAVSFRWGHDQQAARLEREARTDPLTGLSNRLAFDDALRRAIGRVTRFHRRGAVIYADLDGMKSINDGFGHEAGDAFLQEIGNRIRALTRIVDTAARLGGDEFVILLSEFADVKGAEILARRLSETISQPLQIGGQKITPSVSIGIAEFSGEGEGPKALLSLADEAMYAAKRSSTANICVVRNDRIEEVF